MEIQKLKQTVYLPVKIEDELPDLSENNVFALEDNYKFIASIIENGSKIRDEHDYPTYAKEWLKPQEGYFFKPEQLNKYTANVIKQSLETAAENAEVRVTENALIEDGSCYTTYDDGVISVTSDEKSITDTFEETFKKFEV